MRFLHHPFIPESVLLKRLGQFDWRSPQMLLLLMAAAMPLSFSTWSALINNFAVERAAFTGAEIGILQSLREIPGFLAFAVVFLLFLFREQTLAFIALLFLGLGTAITGAFPTVLGLYVTTVIMSIGFHYFETVQQSLALQWGPKAETPVLLGRLIAVGSFASLAAYALIWAMLKLGGLPMEVVYVAGGGATVAIAVFAWAAYPRFEGAHAQHKKMVLRKRYWLYYALTFMSGARRQIFLVFAGFMMVEKFGFDAAAITMLFLVNYGFNVLFAAKIGKLIGRWGERKALVFEYVGLIFVFTAYAFVENQWFAASLYVIDHFFFALAIAIKSYFHKIADPKDIAATAGVGFTINHIAAVFIPAAFGFVWLIWPGAVFLAGTAMAACSLVLALNVPRNPEPGNEVMVGRIAPARVAPAE